MGASRVRCVGWPMRAVLQDLACRAWLLPPCSADLDLTGFGDLAAAHAYLKYPVAVLGLDALRIDVLGQSDNPAEFAIEALLPKISRLLINRQRPCARDRQHISLDRDTEILG